MSARRKGRELALQVLYQLDMSGEGAERALQSFAESFEHSPKARAFGEVLVRGVLAQREQIDERIAEASEHWRLERLSRVDLNVIRIAVYEMTTTARTADARSPSTRRSRWRASSAPPSRRRSSTASSTRWRHASASSASRRDS